MRQTYGNNLKFLSVSQFAISTKKTSNGVDLFFLWHYKKIKKQQNYGKSWAALIYALRALQGGK